MKYEHKVENPDIIKASLFLRKLIGNKKPIFVCIGTDRSTGDSLGPLVGNKLQRLGLTVYGTLDNPIHAGNLQDFIEHLRTNIVDDNTIVIAIDAGLASKAERIGTIQIEKAPLKPGTGMGKKLPEIGDVRIVGMVNMGGFWEFLVLQNTRLSFVMKLAKRITQIILFALSMPEEYMLVQAAVSLEAI